MDNDKNTDEIPASPNSDEIAEAINEIFTSPTEKSGASEPPTLAEETEKYLERIGAQHAAGLRDKETVCVWNAWKAAKHVVKKRRASRDFTLELFGVGYAAACAKWDKLHGSDAGKAYDPARDNGGGIDAAIFNAARGHMLNEAATITNRLNKRKHHESDVLPGVTTLEPGRHDGYGKSGAETPRNYDDVDLFTDRGDNAAISAAADRAARQKSSKPISAVREKPLPVIDGQRRYEAREALELNVAQLLAPLPREERELITQAWGIDGVKRLTIAELAERRGCSEAAVYRSLGRLYAEIASTAAQRRKDSKRWKTDAKAKTDGLRRA